MSFVAFGLGGQDFRYLRTMAKIKPFKALRPAVEHAALVASRPYDVLNREEAKTEAAGNASIPIPNCVLGLATWNRLCSFTWQYQSPPSLATWFILR